VFDLSKTNIATLSFQRLFFWKKFLKSFYGQKKRLRWFDPDFCKWNMIAGVSYTQTIAEMNERSSHIPVKQHADASDWNL